ncbi:MAG: DUF4384 domain-containing protein [Bacillota bacterium]|nr:DUF4384 domain-containing protein [Bacillota bacterium]
MIRKPKNALFSRGFSPVVLAIALVVVLMFADAAFADTPIQVELQLVVEDQGLKLDVWVDRPTYQVGENITVYARTSRDAYVYIFNVSPTGEVIPLLPSSRETSNFVRAGQVLRLPRGNYRITADKPGVEYLVAIATIRPMNTESYWIKRAMDSARMGAPLISTPEGFLDRLRWAELQPFHADAYAATVISFVIEEPYYWRLGNLSVSSTPAGALVFVDGRQVGVTPCTVRDLVSGYHEVTLVKEGYRTVIDQVAVRSGATEYKSYSLTMLGTHVPTERVIFGPWRISIKRENDSATRTFSADLGYSGTIQVRARESYDGKLYQIEGLLTVQPTGSVTQVFFLPASSVTEADRGRTITSTAGPFRVLTTIENVELTEKGSVFSSKYLSSITLSIQVVWTGNV